MTSDSTDPLSLSDEECDSLHRDKAIVYAIRSATPNQSDDFPASLPGAIPVSAIQYWASLGGDHATAHIKTEIANGADVNAPAEHGYTPLHGAAENDLVDNVNLLIASGANPFAQLSDGKTPYDLAVMSNATNAIAILRTLMQDKKWRVTIIACTRVRESADFEIECLSRVPGDAWRYPQQESTMVARREAWLRRCPGCGTEFKSVQSWGVCPGCELRFSVDAKGNILTREDPSATNSGIAISERTQKLISKLFSRSDGVVISNLLYRAVSSNIPCFDNANSEDMERIRFAILKLTQ